MNDDTVNDNQQTSDDDSENTDTKYAASLYSNDENTDSLNRDDLNPVSSDLDVGLADDAYQTYDADDATGLPAENDDDETETGMDEVDADNINPLQENMGDTVIDSDFSEDEE